MIEAQLRGQVRYKKRFRRRKICKMLKLLKLSYNMFITKELSYIWLRSLLTLIVIPTDVFSRPKYPWFLVEPLHEPICKEQHCKTRGLEILTYLDDSVDPCTNFYQYACGGWQHKHPVPPSRSMWTVEIELDYQISLKMRYQLEQPIRSMDSVNLKRFKRYYQTCSSLPNLDKLSLEEVRRFVKNAGPWPMFMTDKDKRAKPWNWADIHYYYFKISADAGLFDVGIGVDSHNNYNPIIELQALHSSFGLILKDGSWKPDWIKNYHHFLVQVVKKVITDKSHRITEKDLLHCMKEVFNFRRKLEEALTNEVFDSNVYHPLTVKELQNWFDSKLVTANNEKINWFKTLNSLFLHSREGILTTNTHVNVKHMKFFQMLGSIISETPTEIIANHLHIYFVERYLFLDTDLECMAQKLITFHGINIGSIRQLVERWSKCISKYNMKQLANEMYFESFFTANAQREITEMFNTMKDMIKMHVTDSVWLDEENKRKALLRINDVELNIGYPNCSSNEKIYRKLLDPNSVHAFYYVDTNRIFISENYLQSPMYTENLPYVVNYASIGSLLGHELYHIFDRIAVNRPIYLKETCQTLWTPKIFRIYEEKSKCIVEQYNRPIQQVLSCSHAPRNDGKKTYNENLADIMSIRTSYDAFKKRLLAEGRTCMILPNLKNINCEKLFFISYAMTFCSNIPDWNIVRIVHNNRHSVPELRVNIPVANMPEFSHAFQCNKTSYENSIKRCYLWD